MLTKQKRLNLYKKTRNFTKVNTESMCLSPDLTTDGKIKICLTNIRVGIGNRLASIQTQVASELLIGSNRTWFTWQQTTR